MIRRVVLVGFMCSGKSTVAPLLAARLGWDAVDLDREVERRAGRRVAEIFAEEGEARFREREAEATRALAGREGYVLAPGGGWVTRPALGEALGPGTFTAWLVVAPETVVARSAAAPGERPLLRGSDPLAAARRLMAEREPFYRRADLALASDGTDPGALAARIEQAVRLRGAATARPPT